MNRAQNLERLRREPFDVLIVGGGINGAGIARDLALRDPGLRVALVEARHFASGTSGKNSHLIHGGLRYLRQLRVRMVRESLRERATLLRIAPALVRPLAFLMPLYGRRDRLYFGAGLRLYDALAGAGNIGAHRFVSPVEEPGLDHRGLRGGFVFYDARVEAARFVLANVLDAAARGVVAANYLRAEALVPGRVAVCDTLSGERFEIRARQVVDATGPWQPGLRLVRGSHIILPRLSRQAIAFFEPTGRIMFVIPWGAGECLSLVGTTDYDHETGPDQVRIAAAEVTYLRSVVARLFPRADTRPIASFSSLRPLLPGGPRSAARATREHRVWMAGEGVLRVAGGKYTTYRAMSEEAVDRLLPELRGRCRTAEVPLPEVPEAGPDDAVRHHMAQRLADVLYVSTTWGYEGRAVEPVAERMAALLGWNEERVEAEISSLDHRIGLE